MNKTEFSTPQTSPTDGYKRSPLIQRNQLNRSCKVKSKVQEPVSVRKSSKLKVETDIPSFRSPSTPTFNIEELSSKLLKLDITPRRLSFSLGCSDRKKRNSSSATPLKAVVSTPFKTHNYKANQKSSLQTSPGTWAKKLDRNNQSVYDRFIPARPDMHQAQFLVSRSKSPDKINSKPITDPELVDSSNLAYQYEVAKACGLALDKRVLSYREEPPASHKDDLKSKYNRPMRPGNTTSAKRKIAIVPERVLDAPGIIDDYYLSLLDWSVSNILAVGLGPAVYVWDASSGTVNELCCFDDEDPVASLSWSQDGSHLAISNFLGQTHLYDVSSNQKVRTLNSHTTRVGTLCWNQNIMSSGSRSGSIHNHDVRIARSRVSDFEGHSGDVTGLKWSFDGSQLASGGNDNLVNVWDARSSIAKYTKNEHNAAVKALAWCPWQSNLLASGGGASDHKIIFWNTANGQRNSLIDTGAQVTQVIFSKQYRELVSAHGFSSTTTQNNLSLWKYPTLQKVCDIPYAHTSRILHLTMSPDGQTVCSGAGDESLKFWKLFAVDGKKRVKGVGSADTKKGKSPDFGMVNLR